MNRRVVLNGIDKLRMRYEQTGEISAGVVAITPAMAEELLKDNLDNRNIRPAYINKVATDIQNGRWKVNGETIIIAKDGSLNNGQHRLLAVIKTGITISTVIVYGIERESRDTVDIGNTRTVGDFLSMESIPNANVGATIAGQLLRWENGVESLKGKSSVDSKPAILDYFHSHREEIEAGIKVTHANQVSVRHLGGEPFIGFTWILLARKAGADTASDFWGQIISGANLREGSALLCIRNRFMRDTSMPRAQRIELLFRAWNAWRENRDVRTLPVTGQIPELS